MMCAMKLSFMIQVLLVFTCEVQTSKANESQRNLLRESFQKLLMNDSEQLLNLQRIFLTPRQKNPNGFYLHVNITVEGRITYHWSHNDHLYLRYKICDRYFPINGSCVYSTSKIFEVLPPAADQSSTVKIFLLDISMVLQVLDPSFRSIARMFQTLDDSYDNMSNCHLIFYTHMNKVEIILDELQTDVRNALYLTLSWVSLKP